MLEIMNLHADGQKIPLGMVEQQGPKRFSVTCTQHEDCFLRLSLGERRGAAAAGKNAQQVERAMKAWLKVARTDELNKDEHEHEARRLTMRLDELWGTRMAEDF